MRINEITKQDFKQINEELEHRKVVVRHELLEEVKRTRAFGDLSENFEYKEAKREKNRNESRIRYLERILKYAKIVEDNSKPDEVGLYDIVEYKIEGETEIEKVQIVSSMKTDALNAMITKTSPVGQALFGHKIGETHPVLAPCGSYNITILNITKGSDSAEIPINKY